MRDYITLFVIIYLANMAAMLSYDMWLNYTRKRR